MSFIEKVPWEISKDKIIQRDFAPDFFQTYNKDLNKEPDFPINTRQLRRKNKNLEEK